MAGGAGRTLLIVTGVIGVLAVGCGGGGGHGGETKVGRTWPYGGHVVEEDEDTVFVEGRPRFLASIDMVDDDCFRLGQKAVSIDTTTGFSEEHGWQSMDGMTLDEWRAVSAYAWDKYDALGCQRRPTTTN